MNMHHTMLNINIFLVKRTKGSLSHNFPLFCIENYFEPIIWADSQNSKLQIFLDYLKDFYLI